MRRWPWRRSREATAYLGLGGNVGDRLGTLTSAIRALDAREGVGVEALSAVYETEPESDVPQDPYLNLVARVATTLTPRGLLAVAQEVEAEHGRDRAREVHWGPRTLDVDLLLHGDAVVDEPDLVVPHPRLTRRAFVLVPLIEVMPPGTLLPDRSLPSQHLARLVPVAGISQHVRLLEGPGTDDDPLSRRPAGPRGGPPRLGPQHGGAGDPSDDRSGRR